MTHQLFVYGTLAPGRPNEHILAPLQGMWQPAMLRGHLQHHGWGAALGFPGLILDTAGEEVSGLLFTAAGMEAFWATLDAFEGDEYARVLTTAYLPAGTAVQAYVYVIRRPELPGETPGAP